MAAAAADDDDDENRLTTCIAPACLVGQPAEMQMYMHVHVVLKDLTARWLEVAECICAGTYE